MLTRAGKPAWAAHGNSEKTIRNGMKERGLGGPSSEPSAIRTGRAYSTEGWALNLKKPSVARVKNSEGFAAGVSVPGQGFLGGTPVSCVKKDHIGGS